MSYEQCETDLNTTSIRARLRRRPWIRIRAENAKRDDTVTTRRTSRNNNPFGARTTEHVNREKRDDDDDEAHRPNGQLTPDRGLKLRITNTTTSGRDGRGTDVRVVAARARRRLPSRNGSFTLARRVADDPKPKTNYYYFGTPRLFGPGSVYRARDVPADREELVKQTRW